MCRPEEWASMLDKFNNMWGIVKESGESSAFVSLIVVALCLTLRFSCLSTFVLPDITDK